LADCIRARVPSAKIDGTIANSGETLLTIRLFLLLFVGDFEIFVNGTQIYSKQSTGDFPDETAVSNNIVLCVTL